MFSMTLKIKMRGLAEASRKNLISMLKSENNNLLIIVRPTARARSLRMIIKMKSRMRPN